MRTGIVKDAHERYRRKEQPEWYDTTAYEQPSELWDKAIHAALIEAGLLIETHARIYERFGGVTLDESLNDSVASSLRALLSDLGIADEVHREYERQVEELQTSLRDVRELVSRLIAHEPDGELIGVSDAEPASSQPQHPLCGALASDPGSEPPADMPLASGLEDIAHDSFYPEPKASPSSPSPPSRGLTEAWSVGYRSPGGIVEIPETSPSDGGTTESAPGEERPARPEES